MMKTDTNKNTTKGVCNMKMRRIRTQSTLDWVMDQLVKGHRGPPVYKENLMMDREVIMKRLTEEGWYSDEPLPWGVYSKDIPKVCVGPMEEKPETGTLFSMGHYFLMYKLRGNSPMIWVAPR